MSVNHQKIFLFSHPVYSMLVACINPICAFSYVEILQKDYVGNIIYSRPYLECSGHKTYNTLPPHQRKKFFNDYLTIQGKDVDQEHN
jgi:hypothetical protein